VSRLRRTAWGVGDQGLSSLTNFVLAIVLARNLDLDAFGAASLGFAAYTIALSVSRAAASEPFTVRHSGIGVAEWRSAAARSVGVALLAGVAAGVLMVLGGAAFAWLGGTGVLVGLVFVATGITLPGLLLQDAWRLVLFADGRAREAFLNDLIWAIALVVTLGVVILSGADEAWHFVLAWGLAGGIAGLAGIVQTRVRPAPGQARTWWREHRDLIGRFVVEALVLSSVSQSRIIVVSAFGGLALGGAIRLGQVVLNAVHPITQGMSLTVVPEAVATARRSIAELDRQLLRATAIFAGTPLVWGIVVWVLPVDLLTSIFGESWPVARATVPGMTLVFIAAGLVSGALVGLRATAAASHSMRARLITAVFVLVGAVVGGLTGDPATCAWILGLAAMAGVPIWWSRYRIARRRPVDGGVAPRMADASPLD
jgi:O-antigen/teichoic acid export membrane protein